MPSKTTMKLLEYQASLDRVIFMTRKSPLWETLSKEKQEGYVSGLEMARSLLSIYIPLYEEDDNEKI